MSSHNEYISVMESNRRFSLNVSRALDCLGKSQDMVKFRVEKYKQREQHVNQSESDRPCCIIAGSKGEGLTAPFESDFDVMAVTNDLICADDTTPFRNINGVTVFKTDRQDTPSGYTKLVFEGMSVFHCIQLQDSLVKGETGQLYLSSDCYFEQFKINSESVFTGKPLDRSGPSQPNLCSYSTRDLVGASRCICPEITQSFHTRHRDYGWPSNDQLAKIACLDGHVVPVGYKGSDKACLEWRICYTKAERFLMCSLNDTQTKLYILLKLVAKTYLNSINKEITSYVLKNIVLWLAECCDIETFKEELLVDRLIQALGFLRRRIFKNNLPNYMIPERNMFSEKLDLAQRQKLVILLTELMDEGSGLLMGCERLRGTMDVLCREPAVAEQYRRKRDMIEKLFLWLGYITGEKWGICEGDIRQAILMMLTSEDFGQIFNVIVTCFHLILPDYQSLTQQGHDSLFIDSLFSQRFHQWLS